MPSIAAYVFATALVASASAMPQGYELPATSTASAPSASASSFLTDKPATAPLKWDMAFALMSDPDNFEWYHDEYYYAGCNSSGPSDNEQAPEEAYVPKLPSEDVVRDIDVVMGPNCKLIVWCHDEDINNVNTQTIDSVDMLEHVGDTSYNFYSGLCEDESQWVSQIRGQCEC